MRGAVVAALLAALLAVAPAVAQESGDPEVRDAPDDTADPTRPELDLVSADFRVADACGFHVDIVVRDLGAADATDGLTRQWNAWWERGDDDREDSAHAGATLEPGRGWWFHVFNPAIKMDYLEASGRVDAANDTLTVFVPYALAGVPPANGSTFTRTAATSSATDGGAVASMGDWAPAGWRPVFWVEYAFGAAPGQQPVAKLPDRLAGGDAFEAPPRDCSADDDGEDAAAPPGAATGNGTGNSTGAEPPTNATREEPGANATAPDNGSGDREAPVSATSAGGDGAATPAPGALAATAALALTGGALRGRRR